MSGNNVTEVGGAESTEAAVGEPNKGSRYWLGALDKKAGSGGLRGGEEDSGEPGTTPRFLASAPAGSGRKGRNLLSASVQVAATFSSGWSCGLLQAEVVN
jgi:hypothetical protein